MKNIAILGSTGSIGTQALDVIKNYPERFKVTVLTAFNNAELLIQQSIQFKPELIVIGNKDKYTLVKDSLNSLPIKVLSGIENITDCVQADFVDIVITAMVGYSGLKPTISAIAARKTIALANKETLVVAGDLITGLARKLNVPIYPVDSEHSAIFQTLTGELKQNIEKIFLTASGGPFRGKSLKFLKSATKQDALKHPNWDMGAKVTIDSASLMNKGLEAIEAKWLFDLDPSQIDVLVHPQSIIHSMVQFRDGSVKAQLGVPDMRLPIQYALTYPERFESGLPRCDFHHYHTLTFEKPNTAIFRNLDIAFEAMKMGGNIPCAMNAANEIAVEAFLNDRIGFLQISDIIEKTLEKTAFIKSGTLDDYCATDYEARELALSFIK